MKKALFFSSICILAIAACQKETSNENPESKSLTKITSFHTATRNEQQSFTVSNTSDNVITTTKGTKLLLPANGFVFEDGRAASGNISVSVKEIFTPMEMILNDMPTVAGSRLLESGGEFKISVSQNNQKLKLAPGNFIKIGIPEIRTSMQGMQVFNGTVDANENVDWNLNNNPGNIVVGDSTLFAKANLFADNVNWLNCDKFINEPTVTFTVHPGNAPSGDSTNVFVHLTGRNTVVKMGWTRGLNYFTSNMLLAVPSTIVGISVKNGQFFCSVVSSDVQNGKSVTLNFTPYTEQQLKANCRNSDKFKIKYITFA